MNEYTIPCTEEQTKKARELGASMTEITKFDIIHNNSYLLLKTVNLSLGLKKYVYVEIPTAEEMIGWLEDKGVLVDINPIDGLHFYWMLRTKELDEGSGRYMWECQYTTPERDVEYSSRREATLAGIDAALEYLVGNKNDKK